MKIVNMNDIISEYEIQCDRIQLNNQKLEKQLEAVRKDNEDIRNKLGLMARNQSQNLGVIKQLKEYQVFADSQLGLKSFIIQQNQS